METFNPEKLKSLAYRTIIQDGRGGDMDRYVYTQVGDGLGSFFGNIFKSAVPFLGRAINTAAGIAKPHLVAAGKDLISAGAKRGISEITKSEKSRKKKVVHRPHRKKTKWRSI